MFVTLDQVSLTHGRDQGNLYARHVCMFFAADFIVQNSSLFEVEQLSIEVRREHPLAWVLARQLQPFA